MRAITTGRRIFMAGLMAFGLVAGIQADGFAQDKASDAAVEGFRSAKFGNKIADVKKAIEKDLGVKAKDVNQRTLYPERREALIAEATDLLPESGKAVVSYHFGYKSQKLDQVNIVWDGSQGREKVLATAFSLQNYFLAQNFPEKDRIVNGRLGDGATVMFRARDSKGRLVDLRLLQQPLPEGKDAKDVKPEDQKLSLVLIYAANPDNPDRFEVEKGAF